MQKRHRVEVAKDNATKDSTFIKCLITVDATLIYEYDVAKVKQSIEWRSKNASKTENIKFFEHTKDLSSRGL